MNIPALAHEVVPAPDAWLELADVHAMLVASVKCIDVPVAPHSDAGSTARIRYIKDVIRYQREIIDAFLDALEFAAGEVADNGGLREKSADMIRNSFDDFMAVQTPTNGDD